MQQSIINPYLHNDYDCEAIQLWFDTNTYAIECFKFKKSKIFLF